MMKIFHSIFLSFIVTVAAIAQPSKQAITSYNNGVTLVKLGFHDQAIPSFKKAVSLYKKYDSAYLAMAVSYVSIGKPDSAIIVLKDAVKILPSFSTAYIIMGNTYRDAKNNLDEAIASYLNAYKIDSTDKTMLYGLAWCNNVKEYYREAVKYAVKALESDNNYNPAYNELGHAYHQLKAYGECVEQFKKNLAISVNDLPLLYSGYCYMEMNQKEDAYKIHDQLEKRNPKMAAALKKKLDEMK